MSIRIRHEKPNEYRRVEEITREAFWNLYFPGCDEHYIAHRIRNHRDFIPELSFVIELDGEIAGSIFYTRSKIVTADDTEYQTVTFGPVSILPRLHRIGLGRRLITHSIEAAHRERAIIIAGYPYHYETYGFVGAKKYGISMPDGKFYKGIMALPLYDGALDGISGKIVFSDVFDVPKQADLDEFDKNFPAKEKTVQDSHREFEIASQEIDV